MFDLATSWPFLVAGGLAALPALLLMTRIQRLEALSYLDSQTGLRNGRLLGDDFALLSRSRAPIALLLADLDNFRRFNAKSYVDGDRALLTAAKNAAKRLGDNTVYPPPRNNPEQPPPPPVPVEWANGQSTSHSVTVTS